MILITSFGVYRYNEKETFQVQNGSLSGHQWRMALRDSIPCSGPSYGVWENANSLGKLATRVPPAESCRAHRTYTSKFKAQLLRTSSSCTFRVVKNPVSSPKTHARVQLGWKVDRVPVRVIKIASACVTNDGPMMRLPTHRANGRDREEWQGVEGWCPHCHP